MWRCSLGPSSTPRSSARRSWGRVWRRGTRSTVRRGEGEPWLLLADLVDQPGVALLANGDREAPVVLGRGIDARGALVLAEHVDLLDLDLVAAEARRAAAALGQ